MQLSAAYIVSITIHVLTVAFHVCSNLSCQLLRTYVCEVGHLHKQIELTSVFVTSKSKRFNSYSMFVFTLQLQFL